MKVIIPAILMIVGGLMMICSSDNDSSPAPVPSDLAAESFREYETLWRAIQSEAAKKLRAGEFTKSQQVTEYRALADGQALKKSRQKLVDAEFAAFGGENWTAEKAAAHFEGYAK